MALVVSVLVNAYLLVFVAAQMEHPFDTTVLRQGEQSQTIAVYQVCGVLNDASAGSFRKFQEDILNDANVRAVVLRIDSPGGAVSSSDQMHEMICRIQSKGKKVVVSMGGVAASGGYYISAPANLVIAEPTTITGSIGVIAQWPIISGTLYKIGAEMMTVKSTHADDWKDAESPFRKPSEEQLARLRYMLDQIQQRFEQIVADGRGSKLTLAAPLAAASQPAVAPAKYEGFNGKVYLAAEAKELGLVDEIGYLTDATDRAAELAGLANPRVLMYKQHRGLMERMMGAQAGMATGLTIDAELVDRIQTPRVLMMWKAE
jgi:protease-4